MEITKGYALKDTYYEGSGHVSMKAEKAHDLLSASWRRTNIMVWF